MSAKPGNVVCDGDVCYYVPDSKAASDTPASGPATSALTSLLGDTLVGKDNANVPLASITGKNKVIGLYFSAHWCGPCRRFTPMLAGVYNKFKASHPRAADWEIVFVSSDRDPESFKEYFAEMPWLALPFEHRELKAKLSSKFKVQGIPTLVILDGETGALITPHGRDALDGDEDCANFPWKPKTVSELLSGNLVDKEGKEHPGPAALAGKLKLIYFSAHWCPPCKAFTPELGKTYTKLKAAGKAVECVFVSSDRTESDFNSYLSEMAPWLAVPFADKATKAALSSLFDVEGIPTLVVLDENDNVVTTNGRAAVASDPEGAEFPWRPKPVEALGPFTASSINDGPTLLLGLDSGAASAQRAEELLGDTARAVKAAAAAGQGDDLSFLWGARGDDLLARVLQFAKVEEQAAGQEVAVLLDIPTQCLYKLPTSLAGAGGALTADAISGFVKGYQAGTLDKIDLGA